MGERKKVFSKKYIYPIVEKSSKRRKEIKTVLREGEGER